MALFVPTVMSADYQNIVVRENSGNEQLFPLVNLEKFSFDESEVKFTYVGDSTKTYDMSSIQKMYFRNTTSGVEDQLQVSLRAYPNPANAEIFISGLTSYPASAAIYDFSGNKVLTSTLENENSSINLSTLPTADYIIKVNNQILKVVKYEK